MKEIPLLYGKPSDKAVLNPEDFLNHMKKLGKLKNVKFPKYCILSFFRKHYKKIEREYKPEVLKYHEEYSFYIFRYKNIRIAFVCPLFGSYANTVLEEMIALGGKYFIFYGGVGVINPEIKRGEIIIPTKAIRDEGTSYHYQKPSKYSYPSKSIVNSIEKTLKKKQILFHKGGTWSIDAPYRETRKKIIKYKKEGILTVEMEAASFFSIGKFRKVDIGGIFIAGDYVGKSWYPRRKKEDLLKIEKNRERLLDIAIECLYEHSKNVRGYKHGN